MDRDRRREGATLMPPAYSLSLNSSRSDSLSISGQWSDGECAIWSSCERCFAGGAASRSRRVPAVSPQRSLARFEVAESSSRNWYFPRCIGDRRLSGSSPAPGAAWTRFRLCCLRAALSIGRVAVAQRASGATICPDELPVTATTRAPPRHADAQTLRAGSRSLTLQTEDAGVLHPGQASSFHPKNEQLVLINSSCSPNPCSSTMSRCTAIRWNAAGCWSASPRCSSCPNGKRLPSCSRSGNDPR